MKFSTVNSGGYNLPNLMRKLGYHPSKFNDSYLRLLGRENYPRFHLYVDLTKQGIQFKLHLDQKKASYKGHTAHSGEYDTEILEQEKNRILSLL